jgi:hypothetical protein
MNAILLPALLLVCGADDKPPAPKLPLGKDTTYVVGPLDKHGYIDYEAALNAEMSKGITPENNANALLIQVLGPAPEGGSGFPPEYFKWLGIAIPPKEGDYFIGMNTYVRDKLGISGERLEKFYEVQGQVTKRPWVSKDCPPMAEWLKANDKQLALIASAMKRPEYFNPLCSRKQEGESSNLIGVLLPSVQKCRELATAFTARAMLRLKEGKTDAAWADILTCHRLGRLSSRGGTLIEGLVGVAICQIASNATITFAAHPDLTAKQALACLKDLQSLPAFDPIADKIGVSERMMGLDALQLIRRNGARGLAELTGEANLAVPIEKSMLKTMDWVTVMQTMNKGYDRLAAAMKIKDRVARAKAFDKIEEEFAASKKAAADPKAIKKLMEGKDAGKTLGKLFGSVLMSLLSPAVQKVQYAHDRAEQVSANVQLAFALAAYKKDAGRYPAELRDLAPKYLKAVPGDLFSGKALVYKPNEKGYLLYSIGVNGKDDGGKTFGEVEPGDDLPVRMPLPELKKKP